MYLIVIVSLDYLMVVNLAGRTANKTLSKTSIFFFYERKEIIRYYFMRDTKIVQIMKNKELLVFHAVYINKKI